MPCDSETPSSGQGADPEQVPVVDVAPLVAESWTSTQDEAWTCSDAWRRVATQIVHAFSTVGFIYVVNHGLDTDKLSSAREAAAQFFSLPTDVKERYSRGGGTDHGWVKPESEILNPERPGCLKECYNAHMDEFIQKPSNWPTPEVPALRARTQALTSELQRLATTLLRALGVGMELQDPRYFERLHWTGEHNNTSMLRFLHYPPVTEAPRAGQLRCAEHTDYGSMTLLMQDDAGGLQVLSPSGRWLDVTPIPGTIVVNLGDLMQRWSSGRLKATVHRVLTPRAAPARAAPRYSQAFFVHPDHGPVIRPVDGSRDYSPIRDKDWLDRRSAETYTDLMEKS